MAGGQERSRPRWPWVLVAALSGMGLLSLAALSPWARATRPPVPRALTSSCSNGGGSSVFIYGGRGRLVSQTDMSVCATGRLTVTFAGDPGTGCAAHGLCGYTGTETWQPQSGGDLALATFEQRGRRSTTATMVLGFSGNPVRSAVEHSPATGTTTACSDQSQGSIGFFSLPVSGARVTIGLRGADAPLLGTRCAGALDADVAAALPSRTVGLGRLLRGDATIDLAGGGPFAAHGLAGTVRSTIVVVLGRPHSSGSAGVSPPPGITRNRLAEVTYRVTHLEGSAVAAVRSATLAAVCGPFDACGLTGQIDVTPGTPAGGSVSLIATSALRRPTRDLLAALGVASGGNPSGLSAQGGGDATLHTGEVRATLTQGVSACRDQTRLRQAAIALRRRAGRLQISVSPSGSQADDPLRTRCPGPQLGSHQLASASLPLSALRRPTLTVALHGGSFSDGPYRVTTRSTLTLTLHRAGIRTRIVP